MNGIGREMILKAALARSTLFKEKLTQMFSRIYTHMESVHGN